MDFVTIMAAGVATGTIYLFAAVGEIFAERSGVLNLGVTGMMLMGAVGGFATVVATGDPWLGLLVGMAGATSLLPKLTVPILSDIPIVGPIFLRDQSVLVYAGYLLVPAAWYWIHRTRPGLNLRAVGEYPAAADAMGVNVYRLRYLYVFMGGLLSGLAGAAITLAIQPGWFGDLTVGGRGWIAIGLVIFAQWDPLRAAVGGYLFGAIDRFLLDVQGPENFFGIRNPVYYDHTLTFFLGMLPFVLVIVVLVVGSREAVRQRIGPRLELEVLEGIHVEADRQGREEGGGPWLLHDDALDPARAMADELAGAEVAVGDGLLQQRSQEIVDVRTARDQAAVDEELGGRLERQRTPPWPRVLLPPPGRRHRSP